MERGRKDFRIYNEVYRAENGSEPPAPLCGGFCFVDESADRAEEMAYQYSVATTHGPEALRIRRGSARRCSGYEFYTNITKYIGRHGKASAAEDFVKLMPYGTPEQVLDKLKVIRQKIGMAAFSRTS